MSVTLILIYCLTFIVHLEHFFCLHVGFLDQHSTSSIITTSPCKISKNLSTVTEKCISIIRFSQFYHDSVHTDFKDETFCTNQNDNDGYYLRFLTINILECFQKVTISY